VLQFSSTVSQLVAQKYLLGVGAPVGAADTVGDGVGFGAAVGVAVCRAVGASVHWSGAIVKHASVTLLQVAQLFVVSKHELVASKKPVAQTLNAGTGVGTGVGSGVGSGVGADVGVVVGADVSGGHS